MKKHDPINSPHQYTRGKIQSIEVIEDWELDFNLGNCIKYLRRQGWKGLRHSKQKELEDLEKAAWYLNRQIQLIKKGQAKRAKPAKSPAPSAEAVVRTGVWEAPLSPPQRLTKSAPKKEPVP